MVFGLLKLLGVQRRPELADLPDQKLWRINPSGDYGMLDGTARGRIDLARVRQHWPDILRLVASVHSGAVSACDAMRMLQHGGNPTQLGQALAHFGRIFKTLHVLFMWNLICQVLPGDDEPACHRGCGHSLASTQSAPGPASDYAA